MKIKDKRQVIKLLLFALLIAGIMLLVTQFKSAFADNSHLNLYDFGETNEPYLINDLATQIANQSDLEKETEIQESAPTTSTVDAPVLLQSLLQDFEDHALSQSGWLHFVYYLESEVNNGVALPQNYYCDGWFLIDETGNVAQHVVSYYDSDGKLNQREIFKNNTFINLTTNEEIKIEGPYTLKIDFGVTNYIAEMQMEDSILTHEVSTIDEKPVEKFTIIGNDDKPTVIGNSTVPVEGVRLTILFTQKTGAISEISYVYLLIDGTEELFYKVQTAILEWADIPEDFIELLED
jgi:hypothetical protein